MSNALNILDLSPRLKSLCRYRRLHGDDPGVLIIDAGYFLLRECIQGFRLNGWKTIILKQDPKETFIERFLELVITRKPDFLFTVNHLGFDQAGVLTRLLEEMEMPFVSWFVDSPVFILMDHSKNASDSAIIAVWERSYLNYLKEFGFQNVLYLPLAGNSVGMRFNRMPAAFEYELSFAGDSMNSSSRRWKDMCKGSPGLIKLLEKATQEIQNGMRVNPLELVENLINIEDGGHNWSRNEVINLASAATLEATRQYRRNMVGQFKDEHLTVFGDQGWREEFGDQINLKKDLNYYSELPQVYNRSKINLNLTSFQMPTAVNQRVFDAPLAGGFLLTDDQEDLNVLFDAENETARFSNLDELKDKMEYFKSKETKRENIMRGAAERILREHTYQHRVKEIINRVCRVHSLKALNFPMGVS